jgi:hypothetical protein
MTAYIAYSFVLCNYNEVPLGQATPVRSRGFFWIREDLIVSIARATMLLVRKTEYDRYFALLFLPLVPGKREETRSNAASRPNEGRTGGRSS